MAAEGGFLVVNSGSSSVEFALIDAASDVPRRVWSGTLERIGFDQGRFAATDVQGAAMVDQGTSLHFSSLALDAARKAGRESVVDADDSSVQIRSFTIDDELFISRLAWNLLSATTSAGKARAHV